MEKSLKNIQLNFDHTIHFNIPNKVEHVYILLHGYLLDGEFMYNSMKDIFPRNTAFIAPNAPFPVPVKKKDFYVPKYAWYFYDSSLQKFYVDFNPAVNYIEQIIKELNLESYPKTIIGYSQGGYIAPKMAETISKVEKVIGLACRFRQNNMTFMNGINYFQIHCENDLIVDYKEAKEDFKQLQEKGNLGEFISLKDVGHRLDSKYLNELKQLL